MGKENMGVAAGAAPFDHDETAPAASHTPGPWKVGVLRKDGRTHSVTILPALVVTSFGRHDHELAANARLIAAAPLLLEALEEIVRFHYGPHDNDERAAKARAAIATALTK